MWEIPGLCRPVWFWDRLPLCKPDQGSRQRREFLGEAGIQGWREPDVGVDDHQDENLAPVEQLIVLEVYGPEIVGSGGRPTVLAQVQAQLLVGPVCFLAVDRPFLADPLVAVADPRLGNLLDSLLQAGRIGPPGAPRRRAGCWPARPLADSPRAGDSWQILELSLDDVLKHLLVERQVRPDPFEAGFLVLKLTQPLHFRRHKASVLLASDVERRLGDPRLADDSANLGTLVGMTQDERHPRLAELRPLHGRSSLSGPCRKTRRFKVKPFQLFRSSRDGTLTLRRPEKRRGETGGDGVGRVVGLVGEHGDGQVRVRELVELADKAIDAA